MHGFYKWRKLFRKQDRGKNESSQCWVVFCVRNSWMAKDCFWGGSILRQQWKHTELVSLLSAAPGWLMELWFSLYWWWWRSHPRAGKVSVVWGRGFQCGVWSLFHDWLLQWGHWLWKVTSVTGLHSWVHVTLLWHAVCLRFASEKGNSISTATERKEWFIWRSLGCSERWAPERWVLCLANSHWKTLSKGFLGVTWFSQF